MQSKKRALAALVAVAVTTALMGGGVAAAIDKQELDAKVDQAIQTFKAQNPKSADALSQAAGVLACPVIRKAGLGLGIERGVCALRVAGKTDSYWRVTGASWGLIAGLQSHGMLLVFRKPEAMESFRKTAREWEIGVDGGVTVAKRGAGGQLDLNTIQGDQVAFIFAEKGILADLSVQGSRFKKIPDSFKDAEALVKVVATAKSGQLQVAITRWTTETERQAIAAELSDKGTAAATAMLVNGVACGRVGAPGAKDVTLRYAYAVKKGDRWKVILATTEPLGAAASWAEARGAKHDVAVIILDIGPHYQGTGQLFLGSELGYDQGERHLTLKQTTVPAIDFHSVSAYD
jgi:lipid-binding SYLF domain-containing protein